MTSVARIERSRNLLDAALLLFTYPALTSAEIVGTDLVQAVPLVAAAVLGHLLFGDVRLALIASLIVVILVSTGLKLLQVI